MIEESFKKKINEHFNPELFLVENESHRHAGPQQESHFKVYIVSKRFDSLSRVERQRAVLDLVKEEMKQGLHALSLRLYTPEEHKTRGELSFVSPNCAGANK